MTKEHEAGGYDKIWRENMHAAMPGLIKKVLHIHIAESTDLPEKLLITKQREVDILQRVVDSSGQCFVLHIEIQTRDDARMIYRMAEYRIMLERQYDLPVKQFVIYAGEGKSKMKSVLEAENLHFGYGLISLSQISYRLFLSSDRPEENLLGVLGNFEGEEPETILSAILEKVKASSSGPLSEERYFRQLRMLVQLRNLAKQFNNAMEKVSTFFKEEEDPFYQKGLEQGIEQGIEQGKEAGREEGKTEVVRNLILNLGLSDEQTANVTGVSVAFVCSIRESLSQK